MALGSLFGLGGVGSGGTMANPGKNYGATATTGEQQTGPITPTTYAYGGGVDLGPKIEIEFPGVDIGGQPTDINAPVQALTQNVGGMTIGWILIAGLLGIALWQLTK